MTVKEIIKKYLKDNGFDGLFYPAECSCIVDDLMSCDSNCESCVPGYIIKCNHENCDGEYYQCIGENTDSDCPNKV